MRAPRLRRGGCPRWVAAALLVLLAGCAWLDTKQRELALRPTPATAEESAAPLPGVERLTIGVSGNDGAPQKLALWWVPNPDPKAPTLLYLHGTFRNLYRNRPKIEALRDIGFSVLAVDYRGWGDSSATVPSEASIYADAWSAWDELKRRQSAPGRRVIYGHSLGGAVAVELASRLHGGTDYGALVLESTFSSLPDVGSANGFWGSVGAMVTTLQFDSRAKIGRVDAPAILMLHGGADRTVPIELGRRLRDAAPPGVVWIEIPQGTHSRLHEQGGTSYRQGFEQVIARLPTAAGPTKQAGTQPPSANR